MDAFKEDRELRKLYGMRQGERTDLRSTERSGLLSEDDIAKTNPKEFLGTHWLV